MEDDNLSKEGEDITLRAKLTYLEDSVGGKFNIYIRPWFIFKISLKWFPDMGLISRK